MVIGDHFALPAASGLVDFVVVGLVADGGGASSSDDVYMSLSAAQTLLGLAGQINTIEVLTTAGAEGQSVTQSVMDQLGPGFRVGALDTGTQFTASLDIAGPVFTSTS